MYYHFLPQTKMNKVAGALKPVHTKETTDMCMVIGESTESYVEIFAFGKNWDFS